MPLVHGTKLGNYEIQAPLGAGGMGEVYRARDTRLGRAVALKVLPQDVASHADRLARFEREAKAVASLNHPNIVVLFSIEESSGVTFLTMELVEGQTLDQLVAPGGLPMARVIQIATAISDALSSAHESGVVHRDLKPSNVMINREGRVKVLDFGLAKLTQEDIGDRGNAATMQQPISSVGQAVGTVPYMAPEQIRGEKVDARADLFSLGIILYELASGQRPFSGDSFADVSSSILRDAPPALRVLRSDLPKDLERIVTRCLEKDRERRFQTAKDVRNELELVGRELAPAVSAREKPAAPSETPSIAVLPFVNRSRSEEDEYFSDGLADELLSVLVKVRGLRVAARTSSASFKGKEFTIADVGRALNVASVLEGSVRKAGNRVRISVQLVKVEDGYPLWSETYDRTLDDIFAVQDDIAQSVVKELRTTLLGAMPDSDASGEARADVAEAAKGRGGDPEAHRLYLQGKHFIQRMSEEDVAKGIDYLKQALASDASHAPALLQLARGYGFQASYGMLSPLEGYRLALEALQRALAIAPEFAEAHSYLATLLVQEHDWAGVDRCTRKALELAPGSADVLAGAGFASHVLGRLEEAASLYLRALERDPLSSGTYHSLGLTYRCLGRLEDAERVYRKALELAPQRIATHHMLSSVLARMDREAEALAENRMEPATWARLTGLAYIHFRAGRQRESDQALEQLKAEYAQDTAYQIAVIHAARGETDEAFEWLTRGVSQRDAGIVLTMSEPLFQPLHGDPRWKEFLRTMGFED